MAKQLLNDGWSIVKDPANVGRHPEGYTSGVLVGKYHHGKGSYVLSTMNILNNVSRHPAADRLLINLVNYLTTFGGMEKL